jgi:hypothetical protein
VRHAVLVFAVGCLASCGAHASRVQASAHSTSASASAITSATVASSAPPSSIAAGTLSPEAVALEDSMAQPGVSLNSALSVKGSFYLQPVPSTYTATVPQADAAAKVTPLDSGAVSGFLTHLAMYSQAAPGDNSVPNGTNQTPRAVWVFLQRRVEDPGGSSTGSVHTDSGQLTSSAPASTTPATVDIVYLVYADSGEPGPTYVVG